MKKAIVALVLAVSIVLTLGIARVAARETPDAVPVTVSGVNYGLLATFAKEELEEADETCAALNALKVTEAKDADGKVIEDLKGKTLHYLPSRAGAALLLGEKHRDQTVDVHGGLYPDAGILAVDGFTVDDDPFGQFPELPIQSMSNQAVI